MWGGRNSSWNTGKAPSWTVSKEDVAKLAKLVQRKEPSWRSFLSIQTLALPGVGVGKTHKRKPKTSLNAFTNYKGKLILARSVGANSSLSYLAFNSPWKETFFFFFSWKLNKVTEMDYPLYGKNSWVKTCLRISHGQAQIHLGFFQCVQRVVTSYYYEQRISSSQALSVASRVPPELTPAHLCGFMSHQAVFPTTHKPLPPATLPHFFNSL